MADNTNNILCVKIQADTGNDNLIQAGKDLHEHLKKSLPHNIPVVDGYAKKYKTLLKTHLKKKKATGNKSDDALIEQNQDNQDQDNNSVNLDIEFTKLESEHKQETSLMSLIVGKDTIYDKKISKLDTSEIENATLDDVVNKIDDIVVDGKHIGFFDSIMSKISAFIPASIMNKKYTYNMGKEELKTNIINVVNNMNHDNIKQSMLNTINIILTKPDTITGKGSAKHNNYKFACSGLSNINKFYDSIKVKNPDTNVIEKKDIIGNAGYDALIKVLVCGLCLEMAENVMQNYPEAVASWESNYQALNKSKQKSDAAEDDSDERNTNLKIKLALIMMKTFRVHAFAPFIPTPRYKSKKVVNKNAEGDASQPQKMELIQLLGIHNQDHSTT